MRDALVFASQSQLDFQDIRTNVIRIPEVVMRIREAQKIWDTLDLPSLDLANFIGSDDAVFLGHIRLKAFATAVIQIGLLDRYLKTHVLPEFVIGLANGDSPLKVVTGELTFFDLVKDSAALTSPRRLQAINGGELPVLSGVQLAKFSAYRRNEESGTYKILESDANQVERLIEKLAHDFNVVNLVVIGPGNSVLKSSVSVQVHDSIELDPALSWFWTPLQAAAGAEVQ